MFDEAFLPLISGLPSWTPIPAIRRSVKARDRIIQNFQTWIVEYKQALSGVASDKSFSDVSELTRQIIKGCVTLCHIGYKDPSSEADVKIGSTQLPWMMKERAV